MDEAWVMDGGRKRLLGHRDGAELLEQAEGVKIDPVVGGFAVDDTENPGGGGVDGFVGGGKAHECAGVGTGNGETHGDAIAFTNGIFNGDLAVGEGAPQVNQLPGALEALHGGREGSWLTQVSAKYLPTLAVSPVSKACISSRMTAALAELDIIDLL